MRRIGLWDFLCCMAEMPLKRPKRPMTHHIYYMGLDRHAWELRLDWRAVAHGRKAVILDYYTPCHQLLLASLCKTKMCPWHHDWIQGTLNLNNIFKRRRGGRIQKVILRDLSQEKEKGLFYFLRAIMRHIFLVMHLGEATSKQKQINLRVNTSPSGAVALPLDHSRRLRSEMTSAKVVAAKC